MRKDVLNNSLVITFVLAISSVGYGQTVMDKRVVPGKIKVDRSLQFDTSKIAILPFHKNDSWVFQKNCIPAKLIQADLTMIQKLLIGCIDEYNRSVRSNRIDFTIDLKQHNYKMQIVAVINSRGEKEVWVNCFCEVSDDKWKKNVLLVFDGGSCFFHLKMNLTTNKFFDLAVNGVA